MEFKCWVRDNRVKFFVVFVVFLLVFVGLLGLWFFGLGGGEWVSGEIAFRYPETNGSLRLLMLGGFVGPVGPVGPVGATGIGSSGGGWEIARSTRYSHSELNGLLFDDHVQYLLVNGSRSLNGSLSVLFNVSAVNFLGGNASFDSLFLNGGLVNTTWWFNQTEFLDLAQYLSTFNSSYDGLVNGSLVVFGNVVAGNVSVSGYFFGEPLDGSIGSGVINSSRIDSGGNVNLSHAGNSFIFSYPDMTVRVVDSGGVTVYCDISGGSETAIPLSHTVYYVDSDCVLKSTSFSNYITTDLHPGGFADVFNIYASDSDIEVHIGVTVKNKETVKVRKQNFYTNHLKIVDGMDVSVGVFPNFTQSQGHYFYIRTYVTATVQNTSLVGVHLVGTNASGVFEHYPDVGLNLSVCDSGSGLVSCDSNQYRRYLLYTVGFRDGMDMTGVHLLVPPTTADTFPYIAACLDVESNPISYVLPSEEEWVAVPTHIYCGRRDDSSWGDGWIDIRVSSGSLGALPDTSQFLIRDGTRGLSGDWDAGSYNISADNFVGNVTGSSGRFSELYLLGGLVNTTWWFNQTVGLDFDYLDVNYTVGLDLAQYLDTFNSSYDGKVSSQWVNVSESNISFVGNVSVSDTFTGGTGLFTWLGVAWNWVSKLWVTELVAVNVSISGDLVVDGVSVTGYYVVRQLNLTVVEHNGSLVNGSGVGYVAGNSICGAEFVGTHFCTEFEIVNYIQSADDIVWFSGDAWVIGGGPKYVPASVPVNDCNGWTYGTVPSYLGNYWKFNSTTGGKGAAINCATELPLACCR